MADNVAITAGAGTSVAADEVVDATLGTVKVQYVKVMDGTNDSTNKMEIDSSSRVSVTLKSGAVQSGAFPAHADSIAASEDDASANADRGVKILFKRSDTPANSSGTDGDYEQPQMSGGKMWTAPLGFQVTVSTDVTRETNTTQYTANDAWSDDDTSPTAGGATFTGVARKSGGSGIITDAIITSSAVPATLLQGEIWLFDTAVTAINDNVAFVISDAEAKTYVGKIPFTLESAGANNSVAHVQNLAIGFTTVGSANLRFLIRVKNAYTPVSGEVLTVRLKIIQTD